MPLTISHHSMVNMLTEYRASFARCTQEEFPRLSAFDNLNFHSKETDWTAITEAFNMIDWTQSLADKSPEEILNTIYEVTEDITKQFVPLRQDKKKKKKKKKKKVLCVD